MPRYVLLARSSQPASTDLDRIRESADLTVIDETAGRSFLVETSEEVASALRSVLPDWVIEREVSYDRPGPRRVQSPTKLRS